MFDDCCLLQPYHNSFICSHHWILITFFLINFGFLGWRQNICVIIVLTSCAAIYLRLGGPQIQVLTVISHWLVQDAVYVLRLKIAKNFQLSENPEITKPWFLIYVNQGKLRRQTLLPRKVLKFSGSQDLSALQTLSFYLPNYIGANTYFSKFKYTTYITYKPIIIQVFK